MCRSPFLIKLQAFRTATLFKSDSNTGFFLWNLRNFLEQLFWRTSANDCNCPLVSISEVFLMCCIWIDEYSLKYPSGNVCQVKPFSFSHLPREMKPCRTKLRRKVDTRHWNLNLNFYLKDVCKYSLTFKKNFFFG